MLDLNHILLLLACLSPLVVLLRTSRRGAQNRSWRMAAIAVWVVTALALLLLATRLAGYIGGGAWLILLFVPMVGSRKATELAAAERYETARRLLGLLRVLHPTAAMRAQHSMLRAMEIARDDRRSALEILEVLGRENTSTGRHAAALSLRLRQDWNGLLAWSRATLPQVGLGENPSLLLLYFRALGELGLRDELVVQIAGRVPSMLASPIHQSLLVSSLLSLFAYCGRTGAAERLLKQRGRGLTSDTKQFWIDTAQASARRMSPLAPLNEATVLRFERDLTRPRSSLLAPQAGATPVVLTIIALNAVMFLLELLFGGSQNSVALQRLGALEPSAVLMLGQYWRLVAALFLHYGALHLMVNAYALYVLGPSLESSIGSWRFLVCYLVSGIGSSAGVVVLWRLGLTQADLLVGASGAVMGIVGTWAGLLLGDRHMPMARRRLINIGLIVGIQTAFDLSTPQVSMAAHLSGFVSGVIVGLIIAPKRDPSWRAA